MVSDDSSEKVLTDSSDVNKINKIIKDISDGSLSCKNIVEDLVKNITSGNHLTNNGLSFLEMKNHMLLDYLINLVGVIFTKVNGNSIEGSSFVDHLVEIRTVLEKIRPIDQKLKYQIDKLVKTAYEGKGDTDPLSFRANPEDLESDDESEEEIDTEKEKSNIYKPPKVAPQHFDDDNDQEAKSAEKHKKRTINKALIRELQEELLDTPIEVHNMGDAYANQLSKERLEKQNYEETYMTRINVTKQEKHRENRMSTLGVLGDEITDFSRKRTAKASMSKTKKRKLSKGGKKKFRK